MLDNSQIPWHPAFVEALQLELDAYKDVPEFHPELQLTTEPLRIDCVVIKKIKEVEIKKNIGRIFRTWNLIEYKSPDDYVSVSDFYKVYGYACIYTYLNQIPITDLTITFIESHYPEKLIAHLKNTRRYTVAETSKGIYTISGDILPIQIIDNRQLSAEDNVWLKSLNNNLKQSDLELISLKIVQQGKLAHIAAYLYAITHANNSIMEEKFMKTKTQAEYLQLTARFYDNFFKKAGLTKEWKEAKMKARVEAEIKEVESKERQKFLELLNQGLSTEEIKQRLFET